MWDIPDILYFIFGGFAAGLTYGIGKIAGSILSEVGKDFYKKIKQCIKSAFCSENQIIEVCIEIEHGRYICFLFPDVNRLDQDFAKAYEVIMDNIENIHNLRSALFNLESTDSTIMENEDTINRFRGKIAHEQIKKIVQQKEDDDD